MHADDGEVCVGKCFAIEDVWREVGTGPRGIIPERSNTTQQPQSQVVEPLSGALVQLVAQVTHGVVFSRTASSAGSSLCSPVEIRSPKIQVRFIREVLRVSGSTNLT